VVEEYEGRTKSMAKWTFEPGHTAAEFCVRHMMVTHVRGHFKDVHGTMELDLSKPTAASIEARIEVAKLWTGEPDRDAHLKSADFLDAQTYRQITFQSTQVTQLGCNRYRLFGNLTIRGVTREVPLDVEYLGQWETSYWVAAKDYGPVTRAGFVAKTRVNRHDFGVSWNSKLDRGGVVVADDVSIMIDVEAICNKDGLDLPA
jgi:polyisoprenoid-binding protein YceI